MVEFVLYILSIISLNIKIMTIILQWLNWLKITFNLMYKASTLNFCKLIYKGITLFYFSCKIWFLIIPPCCPGPAIALLIKKGRNSK
jgi:hypothetical protein